MLSFSRLVLATLLATLSISAPALAQDLAPVAPAFLGADAFPDLVVGPGAGGTTVRVLSVADGTELAAGAPFGLDFRGGVRVAAGDVTGDGVADVIVGAGVGSSAVRVYDGATAVLVEAFTPFGSFTGGVYVAAGDVDGDGYSDIIAGQGPGGGLVRIISGATRLELVSGAPFGPVFSGGVTVAAGDVTGDGRVDIVMGTAVGGGVRIIDLVGITQVISGFPYGPTYLGGISVAAGDVTGDGRAEVVVGQLAAANATVQVFDVAGGALLASFGPHPDARGVLVAAGDVNGDGYAEVITGAGPGGAPLVRVFDGASRTELRSGLVYPLGFAGGVFVATTAGGPGIRFTSETAATFTVGTSDTFTVTTTGTAPITIANGELPAGLTFTDHGNGTATLAGTAGPGTGGVHQLTFRTGTGVTVNQFFTLTVREAPSITSPATATLLSGTAGSFTIATSGFPTRQLTVTGALPPGITFVDNGDSTGTLSGTPAASGAFPLTVTASNGVGAAATQTLTVTVEESAAITSAGAVTFETGIAGSFTVTTTGVPAVASIARGGVALPAGVTFIDHGDGTGTLSGTPAAGTGGTYALTFTATNGVGASAVQSFTLTVHQPASITSVNDTSFETGVAGSFAVTTAGFPTVTTIALGGAALPGGVTFTDHGDGTATLSGTPAAGTGGTYALTFTATNGVGASAVQSFGLTVNQPASITSVNDTTFETGVAGSFAVTTTGFPTVTTIALGGAALPSGVSFADHGDGSGTLSGTPAAGTGGTYALTFTATNGVGASAVQSFGLTVNQPASITSANDATFETGAAFSFDVTTAGFPTVTTIVLGGATLPSGVSFIDNGDGTGTLSGTPAAGTGGTHALTITAANGVGTNATQSFTLTVNQPAQITSAATTTFTGSGTFTVTTTGFPRPALTRTGTLPSGVSFADNGNGTATLSGTPAPGTAGTYALTITAANGVGTNATQSFTLTVNEAPNITSGAPPTFTGSGTFTVTASGFPRPALTYAGALPPGVTFVDNLDGTATLSGTPAAGSTSDYAGVITAANGVGTNDTQLFLLRVRLPATHLVITSVNGGVNPLAGASFNVAVAARDSGGTAVVTADTVVTLSVSSGTGALGGTLSRTIPAGMSGVTFTGLSYTKSESGVTVTASRTSGHVLTPGTSAPFGVNPGTVASYELTPASSNVTIGAPLVITIQPRDAFGNATTGAAAVTIAGRNAADTAGNANVQIDADRNGTYGDAVVNTSGGATTFHVRNNVVETFRVRADDGTSTGTSSVITVLSVPTSPVLISEFRFRGPAGIRDEYIVVSNTTDVPITVSTSDGSAGWALVGADAVVRATIPNGTILPARGAYLITNNGASGFGLGSVPAGVGTTVGGGDLQYSDDIPASGVAAGVALFRSTLTFDLTTRIDAVGYTTVPALYREGAGMTAGGAEQVVNLQQAYVRSLAVLGIHKDTNDNKADFTTVDTNGTLTGNGQRVGMPGPRSTLSPVRNDQIAVSLVPDVPATVRDQRSYTWNVPGGGTVGWPSGVESIARRFTNNSGQPITRLRVRVIAMTTFPENSGTADLRPIDGTGTVTDSSGTVIKSGLQPMLLENPQLQFNGGGIHSTMTLDMSQLPGGVLGVGESVDVHMLLGVAQTGTEVFQFIVETLP